MCIHYRHEISSWRAPKLGFLVWEPLNWLDGDNCWVAQLHLLWVSFYISFIPKEK
jgi:hypothetical protein